MKSGDSKMNLEEILNISGNPLEEATLTQVIKRINRHKEDARDSKEFIKLITKDGALKSSLDTISSATPEEQEAFSDLLNADVISKAINSLPPGLKIAINKLAKLSGEIAKEPEKLKVKGSLTTMHPKDQAIIQSMQKEFMKAKDDQSKAGLIKKWTSDIYNAKLYKLAKKEGII